MSGPTALSSTGTARDPAEKKVDGDAEIEAVMGKFDDLKRASQQLDQFFVWPEASRPDIAHDSFDFELPIIDLSPVFKLESLQRALLQQGSDHDALTSQIESCLAEKSGVEKEIRAACETYGFFQIVNHGFPLSLVDQLRQSFIQLFDLPLEVKEKVAADSGAGVKTDSGGAPTKSRLIGYNLIKRSNAISRTVDSHIWNEGFELGSPEVLYPGAAEEFAMTLWPDEPEISQQWRSAAEQYTKQASMVSSLVVRLMSNSLGFPDSVVDDLLGYNPEKAQAEARLRVNHYPVCAQPELTWGIHAHTDPSVMTLLHQDDVGGLQIGFKDGTWHGVRPIAGAFVVNVGDYCISRLGQMGSLSVPSIGW